MEIRVSSQEELCDLMCLNKLPKERRKKTVEISAKLTKEEWNWLKAKLNNEFIDSEIAQSILKKIEKRRGD